jgi:hypothetical protein
MHPCSSTNSLSAIPHIAALECPAAKRFSRCKHKMLIVLSSSTGSSPIMQECRDSHIAVCCHLARSLMEAVLQSNTVSTDFLVILYLHVLHLQQVLSVSSPPATPCAAHPALKLCHSPTGGTVAGAPVGPPAAPSTAPPAASGLAAATRRATGVLPSGLLRTATCPFLMATTPALRSVATPSRAAACAPAARAALPFTPWPSPARTAAGGAVTPLLMYTPSRPCSMRACL